VGGASCSLRRLNAEGRQPWENILTSEEANSVRGRRRRKGVAKKKTGCSIKQDPVLVDLLELFRYRGRIFIGKKQKRVISEEGGGEERNSLRIAVTWGRKGGAFERRGGL